MDQLIDKTYQSLLKQHSFDSSKESQAKSDIQFALNILKFKDEKHTIFGSLWLKAIFEILNFPSSIHSLLFKELEKNLLKISPELSSRADIAGKVDFSKIDSLVSMKKELLPQIVDLHIGVFTNIESCSTIKYRTNLINDGEKHLEFIKEANENDSPEIFKDYCTWVNSVLNSLGIEKISLIRYLVSLKLMLKVNNDSTESSFSSIIDSGIHALLSIEECNIEDNNEKNQLCSEYLKFLLDGDRKAASAFIHKLIEGGTNIKDIYLKVFQESQYEIGRLWEKNEISVAQEHYCTATTQMIMSQLYTQIFNGKNLGYKLVATCVGNELHEIGVRMVADFMEMEGWDTYYLGANTPADAIIEAIKEYDADVLAISVTMTPHLGNAKRLINTIREKSINDVKILVGGYPFHSDADLWKKIGADGFAKSAFDVHESAIQLLR